MAALRWSGGMARSSARLAAQVDIERGADLVGGLCGEQADRRQLLRLLYLALEGAAGAPRTARGPPGAR